MGGATLRRMMQRFEEIHCRLRDNFASLEGRSITV